MGSGNSRTSSVAVIAAEVSAKNKKAPPATAADVPVTASSSPHTSKTITDAAVDGTHIRAVNIPAAASAVAVASGATAAFEASSVEPFAAFHAVESGVVPPEPLPSSPMRAANPVLLHADSNVGADEDEVGDLRPSGITSTDSVRNLVRNISMGSFIAATPHSQADPEQQRYLASGTYDVPVFATGLEAIAAAQAQDIEEASDDADDDTDDDRNANDNDGTGPRLQTLATVHRSTPEHTAMYSGHMYCLQRNAVVTALSAGTERQLLRSHSIICIHSTAASGGLGYVAERDGKWLRKMGQPWAREVSARRFLEAARGYIHAPGLDKVMLLRTRDLLSAGRLPLDADVKGRLVSHPRLRARQVSLELKGFSDPSADKVLFVSHRWYSKTLPDTPSNQCWHAIIAYLENRGDIPYIWLDCACLPLIDSNSTQAIEERPLSVVPAVLASDDFLLIPGFDVDVPTTANVITANATSTTCTTTSATAAALELERVCGRAWMQLEIACAIAGNLATVIYSNNHGAPMYSNIDLSSKTLARAHDEMKRAAAVHFGIVDSTQLLSANSSLLSPRTTLHLLTPAQQHAASSLLTADSRETRSRSSGLAAQSFFYEHCLEPAVLLERAREDLERLCGEGWVGGCAPDSTLLQKQTAWRVNTMKLGVVSDPASVISHLTSWKYVGDATASGDRELVIALLMALVSYADGHMGVEVEDVERDDATELLWESLRDNESTLRLVNLDLTPEVTRTLIDVAFELGLSLNKIIVKDTYFGGHAALQALQTLESLMEMNIDHCGCSHVKDMGLELSRNRGLGTLTMPYNNLRDDGFQHIAAALSTNFTLKMLDCSHNNIGDVGAEALAFALIQNDGLRTVSLSYNCISDRGAKAIADVLTQNITLQSLDLTGNPISEEACVSISDAWGLRPARALFLPVNKAAT
jgi:Leucine Rich repeat